VDSTFKRKAIITLSAYIGVIIIFSVIYWRIWIYNSDSFLINNEINESPSEAIRAYLRSGNKSSLGKSDVASNLQEIMKLFRNDIDTLELQKKDAINLSERIAKYERAIKGLREKNLKISLENKAAEINKEIESLEEKRKWFDNFNKDYLEAKKGINIQIAPEILEQINFSRIAINQAILQKELWMFDKEEVKQALALFDKETIHDLQKTIKDKSDNLERFRVLEDKIAQFNTVLQKESDNIYKNRTEKLGYIDFLYFSVITSTTTGYGDIVPNRTLVRVFVMIQLFVSLILFGLFLAWLTESFKKNTP